MSRCFVSALVILRGLLPFEANAQEPPPTRYRTVVEIVDGHSLGSDGKGAYVDGMDQVSSNAQAAVAVCTGRIDLTCVAPTSPGADDAHRYHLIDLSNPIDRTMSKDFGVISSSRILFATLWDNPPAPGVIRIPLRERVASERTELHLFLDGSRHVLQFGPSIVAQGRYHGQGTTRATIERSDTSAWVVRSGPSSVGRLWDLGDPESPLDRGLYRFSFEVSFHEPPIHQLVNQASDTSAYLRNRAAHVLGRMGARGVLAVPALHELLSDPRPYARTGAGEALDAIFRSGGGNLPGSRVFAEERIDTAMVDRIREEATQRSQVMEIAWHLSDLLGPRLTGSPQYREAGQWMLGQLRDMGLASVHAEYIPWGRSWSLERQSIEMTEPQYASLIGVAVPWSPSTAGPSTGEVVLAPLPTASAPAAEYEAFFTQFAGKLRGRIVLANIPRNRTPDWLPRPQDDRELAAELANSELASVQRRAQSQQTQLLLTDSIREMQGRLNAFLRAEGVLAVVMQSNGYSGTVLGSGPNLMRSQPSWLRNPASELPPPTMLLANEHYLRLTRLLENGIGVTLRVDLQSEFHNEADAAFNLIAEIPGTDKAQEVVMLGAHFDSWTGATGATDNAAGTAVVVEAARILRELDVTPRRTIRLVLWGGHEGEGLGARTYVGEHLANGYPQDWVDEERGVTLFTPTPEHEKVSVYFNLDNGAGRIRGIYDQLNDAVRPIFKAWFAPFEDLETMHLASFDAGGTDHQMFDAVGIPGFQFIQDGGDQVTLTHHSNMDHYEYLSVSDLQQSALILASFVYHAAMRDELLPRRTKN